MKGKRFKWRLLMLVLLLILSGVGYGWRYWLTYPSGVSFINYCKIRPGMTPEEVEQILGKADSSILRRQDREPLQLQKWSETFEPHAAVIWVRYDAQEKVASKVFVPQRNDSLRRYVPQKPQGWRYKMEDFFGQVMGF